MKSRFRQQNVELEMMRNAWVEVLCARNHKVIEQQAWEHTGNQIDALILADPLVVEDELVQKILGL